MLPYVWLSLAIVSLWLPSQSAAERWPLRIGVSAGWLALAIGHAYVEGIVTPIGLVGLVTFGLLCWGYSRTSAVAGSVGSPPYAQPWSAPGMAALVAVILFSLALMAHVVPGFVNLLIVRNAALSPGAAPYTLYFNFDKALIGLFLAAFGPPLASSRAEWLALLRATLPRALASIVAVMLCALALQQVRVDLKWPAFFPYWAWANLLFTCTAEESLFRGVIQRRLQGDALMPRETGGPSRKRAVTGLIAASVVFGVAHYAGGAYAIVLATIAGTGYGWVFWRTQRIEASILTHFLLNTTHILCFTYPARL